MNKLEKKFNKVEQKFNEVSNNLIISAGLLIATGMLIEAVVFIYAACIILAVFLVFAYTIHTRNLVKDIQEGFYLEAIVRAVVLLVGILITFTVIMQYTGV